MHLYPKRATVEGVEAEIFKLMSYGATTEQWTEWLRAPLEHAAASGNLDLVTRLLKAGADGGAGWRGCRGRTLLDAAALGGNADVVSALVLAGCGSDMNVVSVSSRRSALYVAVVCGHEAAARELMVAGADVNNFDPVDQCNPIHAAARGGHKHLVCDLLIGGASPNARDRLSRTPLHIAAELNHVKVVHSLLVRAADKDALDRDSRSPLMLAAMQGHVATVNALLDAGADVGIRGKHPMFAEPALGMSAFDLAAHEGRVCVLQAMVDHGVDVKAANEYGYTALHHAAGENRVGAIHFLLDAGADVNLMSFGFSPLVSAAVGSHCGALVALLRGGADVNGQPAHSGVTALHMVLARKVPGCEAIVDVLLRWGAFENAVDKDGHTPADVLEICGIGSRCSEDEVERVRVLLARAPVDRAWRRRGWLTMLRSRAEGQRVVGLGGIGSSNDSFSSDADGREVLSDDEGGSVEVLRDDEGGGVEAGGTGVGAGGGSTDVAEQRVRGGGDGGTNGWSTMVDMVVGLESESVFRTIVGHL